VHWPAWMTTFSSFPAKFTSSRPKFKTTFADSMFVHGQDL